MLEVVTSGRTSVECWMRSCCRFAALCRIPGCCLYPQSSGTAGNEWDEMVVGPCSMAICVCSTQGETSLVASQQGQLLLVARANITSVGLNEKLQRCCLANHDSKAGSTLRRSTSFCLELLRETLATLIIFVVSQVLDRLRDLVVSLPSQYRSGFIH
jgi:hypothetical protein